MAVSISSYGHCHKKSPIFLSLSASIKIRENISAARETHGRENSAAIVKGVISEIPRRWAKVMSKSLADDAARVKAPPKQRAPLRQKITR